MADYGYGLQFPPHVHSQAYWADNAAKRGWAPSHAVRWLLTNLSITPSELHDHKHRTIDNACVQYRLNRLDMVHFQNFTITEFLLLAENEDRLDLSLYEFIESKLHREPVVDSDAGLGAVVQVDAIYHDQWIALPHEWGCRRDAVFDADTTYADMVNGVPMSHLLRHHTCYLPISDATSSRICRYTNAHHCMWQIGMNRFHVEQWKRPDVLVKENRPTEGWTETVTQYNFPGDLTIDPERINVGRKKRHEKVQRPTDFDRAIVEESR